MSWAAGFFDGEGCVMIKLIHSKQRTRPFYQLRVSISQKAVAPLLEIQRAFSGSIFLHKDSNAHELVLTSAAATRFLTSIRRYLRVKGPVADYGLALADTMDSKHAGRGRSVPTEITELRERLRQGLHRYNQALDKPIDNVYT